MISHRHAEASRPVSFQPLLKAALTVAAVVLVAYGAIILSFIGTLTLAKYLSGKKLNE